MTNKRRKIFSHIRSMYIKAIRMDELRFLVLDSEKLHADENESKNVRSVALQMIWMNGIHWILYFLLWLYSIRESAGWRFVFGSLFSSCVQTWGCEKSDDETNSSAKLNPSMEKQWRTVKRFRKKKMHTNYVPTMWMTALYVIYVSKCQAGSCSVAHMVDRTWRWSKLGILSLVFWLIGCKCSING